MTGEQHPNPTAHGLRPTAHLQPAPRAPRPRVACFTPLSPVSSGISFYSEDLLPVLARALDLDLFVDGYTPSAAASLAAAGARVRAAREFDQVARRRPYDAVIYQMGNGPAHAYMYDRALRTPGLVVLHDVVLHHLQLWMAVNRGRRREYAAQLARLYGPEGQALARAVLRGQTPPALFDYPLVEPVLETARVVIVHNAASVERVRQLRPGTDVRLAPMGVPLPALPPRQAARARLGVPPDAFLVLSHGHVTPYKRLDVALRAFHRLSRARPDARFLIAGGESPNLGLDRQIGYLGLAGRVERLGFVPPETVADLLAAADCCVNLRYPSAGETSASLLRIMAAGLPVIVSDAASFRELPDGSCVKIPVGPLEEALLAEYLIELARDEPLREALGARAREFVANEHSLERSAAAYLDALAPLVGHDLALPPAPPAGGTAAPDPARNPAGGGSVSSGAARGAEEQPALAGSGAAAEAATTDDPLLDGVADALVELRLAGHDALERSVARDLTALGLGAAVDRAAEEADKRGGLYHLRRMVTWIGRR